MKYAQPIVKGRFLERPNRFIAHIEIDGEKQICHVKNTGRCRELLQPHATVYCTDCLSPARKTRYDLIAVKKGNRLINMDSQIPNAVVGQWLTEGGFGVIDNLKPETTVGDSRFDFSFVKNGKKCFLEVKGVTLENNGVCAFPDAPTQRGAKHLRELSQLAREGHEAYAVFVIQMEGVTYIHPNDETDPAFGKALRQAAADGVKLLAFDCKVTPNSITLNSPVPIVL